jgi:hypothetical protein
MAFGLNRLGRGSTIYHIRGEHAKQFTTDAIVSTMGLPFKIEHVIKISKRYIKKNPLVILFHCRIKLQFW